VRPTPAALAAPARVRPGPALGYPGLWAAAVVLGVACAMKYTAWPALAILAILAVMITARDGVRAAFSRGRTAPDPVARLLRVPSRIRS
jgi:hypothetical protein